MILPDERSWRYVNPLLWAVVAIMAHATFLTAIYYWPYEPEAEATPLSVALIEGTNPYIKERGEAAGRANVPAVIEDEPPPSDPPTPAPPEAVKPEPADQAPPRQPDPPLEQWAKADPPPLVRQVITPPPTEPLRVEISTANSGGGNESTGQSTGPPGIAVGLAAKVAGSSIYANRFGKGKQAAMERFGGRPDIAVAIADALAWLAKHQEPDGHWDRVGFGRHCPKPDPCGNPATVRVDRSADAGLTGLCLLAFLGNGHLPDNQPDKGRPLDLYADTTHKAITYLLTQQRPDGAFGPLDGPRQFRDGKLDEKEPLLMYNHAIATLALAEAYSLTRDPKFVEPLTRGVKYLAATQQPQGGWDYGPDMTNRNDTSITGWAVMALKAAATAGIDVPTITVYRAAGHFARATDPAGQTWYADRGTGVSFDKQTGLPKFRFGPAMVAVAAFSRQLLGYRSSSPEVMASINRIAAEPPNLALFCRGGTNCLHNEYYWYYATMAMFQTGGRAWTAWSPAIQQVLLGSQDRTRYRDGAAAHRFGSWAAYGDGWGGNWGATGGRIYATAINALTLEVFFRYLPLNEMAADYDYSAIVDQVLANNNPVDRHAMIAWLGQLRPQLAEPIFYKLLASEVQPVRFAAAVQLAMLGSPLARPVLEREMNWASPAERIAGDIALNVVGKMAMPDTYGPIVEVDSQRGLVSFRTGNNYVGFGLPVAAVDNSARPISRMRIVSFDREQRTAVGKLEPADRTRWADLTPGLTVKLHLANQ